MEEYWKERTKKIRDARQALSNEDRNPWEGIPMRRVGVMELRPVQPVRPGQSISPDEPNDTGGASNTTRPTSPPTNARSTTAGTRAADPTVPGTEITRTTTAKTAAAETRSVDNPASNNPEDQNPRSLAIRPGVETKQEKSRQ